MRKLIRLLRDSRLILCLLVHSLRWLRKWRMFQAETLYRHVPFRGVFEVLIPNGGAFRMRARGGKIENDLYWCGILGHEPKSIDIWIKSARAACVVLDIGANSGVFSLSAAAAGAKHVYSFEPVDRIYQILEENICLSKMNNVHPLCVAVGALNGWAEICIPAGPAPTSSSLSDSFVVGYLGQVERRKIRMLSVDSWAQEQGIARVDLIKVDVEGYEEKVLRGMKALVCRDRPKIFIEALREYERDLQNVVQELWPSQYDWLPIDEGKNNPSRLHRFISNG